MKSTKTLNEWARNLSWLRWISAALVILGGLCPAVAGAQGQDQAQESALRQFEQTMLITRDGKSHNLMTALRHLKDPELKPYFEYIAGTPSPLHQIHGILGQAEISQDQTINLLSVAELKQAFVQGQIITAAMDSELVSDDQLSQLLEWPGLDIGVKMLILTNRPALINQGHVDVLEEALKSELPARTGLAGLLLLQNADPRGLPELQKIDALSDANQRDPIRGELLRIALNREFDTVRDWAFAIANQTGVDPKLKSLALLAALRFGHPQAQTLWIQSYQNADNLVQKLDYAINALRVATFTQPGIYQFLAANGEIDLIKKIGAAGASVSSNSADIADRIVELIDMQHALVNGWAIKYANKYASPENAQLILFSIIYAYPEAQPKNKLRRLEESVTAAQYLFELSPEMAYPFLRPLIEDPKTDPKLLRAVLLGILRSRTPGGSAFVDGIDSFGSGDGNALALVLKARNGVELSARELQDFAIIVRGGSDLQDSLRMQAAWLYLKYTGMNMADVMQSLKP